MNTKELVLVLGAAAVGGGVAAFAAGALRGEDSARHDADLALAGRLDRIENALAKLADGTREQSAAITEMKTRVESAESLAGRLTATINAPGTDVRPGRARRPDGVAATDTAPSGERAEKRRIRIGGKEIELGALGAGGLGNGGAIMVEADGLSDEIGGLLNNPEIADQISKSMAGVTNSFKLRTLPEAERWSKAKEDLGLNDGQVDSLKQAVATRDEEMKAAFQTDSETQNNDGSRFRLRTLNPEKARAAEDNYRAKVGQTLDETQKKSWDEKGYSHAFGKGPGGGVSAFAVHAVDVRMGGDPKDEKSPK